MVNLDFIALRALRDEFQIHYTMGKIHIEISFGKIVEQKLI